MDGWTPRLLDDMPVAAFYGQLFSQAEPLPVRPNQLGRVAPGDRDPDAPRDRARPDPTDRTVTSP
jgi:hypothetical protein